MHPFRTPIFACFASLVAFACAGTGPTEDQINAVDQAIINGTPVLAENVGAVRLNIPGSGCSGTLITPEWVLTAQHCLPAVPEGTTVERTTTGEIRNAVQLIPWSRSGFTTDVGLIRVSEPFSIEVGADGYTNPPWPYPATDLVGATVDCYGYGYNTPEGTGFGTLRYAALPIISYDPSDFRYVFQANALGQIQTYGDSGSGCFYTQNGRRYQVSVFTNPAGERALGHAAADIRSWVELNVHSRCDDGIQSGAETGVDCGGACPACPAPATLTLTSQWDTGWCAEVAVKNYTGVPTTSWSVQLDVHDSNVYAQWSADFTHTGSLYTATNLSWNGNIPSLGTTSFGFCANKTGSNWQPTIVSSSIQ
ncbi:MAG: cellulose binding domain-containing protein [Polyangiaceae bacterium]